ncbi:leader peptidase (prepilin peptidase) / N-methyltransferase [Anaerocolumna xylanovorans DSM 12503]|uniref:Leader peptidase (Prepilin peptidase) / N-methyltransferase n=2 Tax=Anaerocolumna TaxID=1843210 RepID=A0A1M7YNG8_9FIRM|nr:leader peptidase (prepilin peptidase) / N-methyltransferase [Anaerocolumna xylanovorans DSM 12503]
MFYYSLLILFLTTFAVYDVQHKRVPDLALVCFLPFVLLSLFINDGADSGYPLFTWMLPALGAIFGGGILLSAAMITNGGIGGGDIKLAAMLGFVYGPYGILLALFFSVPLAFLFGLYERKYTGNRFFSLPFVPFLAIGCYAVTILKLYQ